MSCPASVLQCHVHGRSIALALAAFVAAALLAIPGLPSPALADDEAAETPGETPQLVEPAFEEVDADAAEEDDMVALAASVTDQPLWEATRTENLGQVRALSRSKDLVIILGVCVPGAAGYDSTQYLVDKIKEDLSGPAYDNVQYIVMDMGGKDTSRPYADWTTSKISVCARGGQWGYDYWNWAKTNYKKATGKDLEWGNLPEYLIVRNENIVSTSRDKWDLGVNIANSIGYSSDKYASYTYALRGTMQQSEARKLRDLVNAERRKKGVADLQWDVDMEQTAMQRAVELSLLYAHERPDGRSVFTAWPSKYRNTGSKSGGENIAVLDGSTIDGDAEGINSAWINSGPHYAAMVNGNYKSFGAACFVDANGLGHWVECFSSLNGTGFTTTAVDGERWTFVGARPYVLGSLYASFGLGDQVVLAPGEQLDLGSRAYVTPWESNPEHQTYVRSTFVQPEWYPWNSSDTSVASVGRNEGDAGWSRQTTSAPPPSPCQLATSKLRSTSSWATT